MSDDVVVVLVIVAVIVDLLLRRLLTGQREIVGRLEFRLLDVTVVIAGLRVRLVVGCVQVLLELSSLFRIVDLAKNRREATVS